MLPPASLPMPATWRDLLEELAPVFARRSTHRLFVALACGMILADRSTVVAMAAAGGMAGKWRRACWFFSGAVWDIDDLGLAVARLVVKYLAGEGEPVVVACDGTFFKRWGRKVFQARWAYDGSAQGGKKIAFGNTWVVAAIVVRLPFCSSPAALPVLFRLWRGKGTASQVELAAEMVKLLAGAFPGRVVHGVGDAAFHGESLIVEGTTWTTRLPSNAVLYGPKPPRTGKRGRPKVKGDRLGTCAQMAAQATWTDAIIDVYGQDTAVQVAAAGALWHGSFKTAVVAIEADFVAADLVLQVSQQGRRQPFPVRQIRAVLADDGGQGAQVPVAGPHRSAHRGPPISADGLTVRPAVPVRASVERPIAEGRQACRCWT